MKHTINYKPSRTLHGYPGFDHKPVLTVLSKTYEDGTIEWFNDVHFSGKFSAEPDQMRAAIDDLIDHVKADRIRITEVSPAKWRKVLIGLAKKHGWHVYHPKGKGKNECAILSRLPITAKHAYRATRLALKFGRTAPTYVIAARTKGWGWAPVLHTPAHTGGLKKGLWPTRVYRDILDRLGTLRLLLGRLVFWSADWNLDLRLDKNRTTILEAIPGGQICAPHDQHPTEGNRVIDGHVLDVKRAA